MKTLMTPQDLDALLRFPNGRSVRLARRGIFPHIRLPDGSIRFDVDQIAEFLGLAEPEVGGPSENKESKGKGISND